jgi:membrane protease YdiL (CAAX protease family)
MSIINASGAVLVRDARETLSELWAYLKKPTLRDAQTDWDRRVWISLAVLILLDALLTIPVTMLLAGYDNFIESGLSRELPSYVAFDDEGFLELMFWSVLVAPLFEEALFRGWLTGKWKHFVIGSLWIVWIIAASIFMINDDDETAAIFVILMFVILAITAVIAAIQRRDQSISPMLTTHFSRLFWFSAVSFGLIHLTNYEYDNYWLVIPYVLPQFLAGAIWGYARIYYGLWASILLHATSNLWITCIYFGFEGAGG